MSVTPHDMALTMRQRSLTRPSATLFRGERDRLADLTAKTGESLDTAPVGRARPCAAYKGCMFDFASRWLTH